MTTLRDLRRALHPRLRVSKGRLLGRVWLWRVITPTGEWIEAGSSTTHAEALAVGLAALEAATLPAVASV